MIYADNAATTRLDPDALEAMRPWLTGEYGNPSSAYAFARSPKQAIRKARETIANAIGALPEEIYFTSGGTESDNWAVKGTAFANANTSRNKIFVSEIEHHAVLNSCKFLEHLGYPVGYISPTKDGIITEKNFRQTLPSDALMASVMLVNNELGTIQPIRELVALAHAQHTLFHTDAVQAVGHMEIDVRALGVDMLSASAHKFNGPKGVGFLYMRSGINLVPYMDGGAQEKGMRAGTENVAGIVGMAVALKNNIAVIKENKKRIQGLENLFIQNLKQSGVSFVRNGGDNTMPGLISISLPGKTAEAIMHRLDLVGISISTGSACNSHQTEISHVLQAISMPKELAEGTIRISLGKDNTEADIEVIVTVLTKLFRLR